MLFANTGLLSRTSLSVSCVSPPSAIILISLSSIVSKSLSSSVTYAIQNVLSAIPVEIFVIALSPDFTAVGVVKVVPS